jgi:hypothetical protein
VPNSGYAVGSLHERSGCRADPTMTISYTRHPLLSSGSVSPWKSTAPRSYRCSKQLRFMFLLLNICNNLFQRIIAKQILVIFPMLGLMRHQPQEANQAHGVCCGIAAIYHYV